jgi:hypothetical protein
MLKVAPRRRAYYVIVYVVRHEVKGSEEKSHQDAQPLNLYLPFHRTHTSCILDDQL